MSHISILMRREASRRNDPQCGSFTKKTVLQNTPVDFKTALLAMQNVGEYNDFERKAFEKQPTR